MVAILILLVFISSTTSQTHPSLTTGCRRANKQKCQRAHFVPGHALLGEGFDIVKMEQKRSHLLDMQSFATEEDETCTVCYNHHMKKAWQKLPLAMMDWNPRSSCSRKVSSEVSRSSSSLAEEAASEVKNDWEAGLELQHPSSSGKVTMAGSQSQLEQFAQKKTSSDQYTFIKHQLSCVYYSFRLSHSPPLSKDLIHALNALPSTYDVTTHPQYRRFIGIFGTHFIRQADVGGRAVEVNAIKTCRAAMDGLSVDELKDCLSIEALLSVTGKAEANAKVSACKELSQKANRGQSFHQTFSERSWQVNGGKITFNQLSFDGTNVDNAEAFDIWMESLKTDPDIVSYSLEPIHNLVGLKGVKRESVRRAVSEYIMDNALRKNCSCSKGTPLVRGGECSCICTGSDNRDVNCCPTKKGLAKVEITVQQAQGLWGDYLSRTDAFVKISFGIKAVQTPTIWNNDNPAWDVRFDLGVLDLTSGTDLKVEVWDEDNEYDDDLLGKCQKPINSGNKDEVCYLSHGSLTFTVRADCIPHLAGPQCSDYAPSPN